MSREPTDRPKKPHILRTFFAAGAMLACSARVASSDVVTAVKEWATETWNNAAVNQLSSERGKALFYPIFSFLFIAGAIITVWRYKKSRPSASEVNLEHLDQLERTPLNPDTHQNGIPTIPSPPTQHKSDPGPHNQ